MIARIQNMLAKRNAGDKGFTLIELLVVMIIIGILAAIAIPIFLNQRKKAEDTAAKADVSTLGKEIATYYVDGTLELAVGGGNGVAYTLTPTGGAAIDVGPSSDNVVVDASTDINDRDDWCVAVTNDKGDKAVAGFRYSHDGGLEEGLCP